MDEKLLFIVNESIKIELNVSELYTIFHKTFTEHKDFWWELLLEEENHAALIKSGVEYYDPTNTFPDSMVSSNLKELEDVNNKIVSLIKECCSNPPSEEEAFNIALEFEQSAGEIHYQVFMGNEPGARNIDDEKDVIISKIFKELNADDKDHADRIRTYMNKHGIKIREQALKNTS